jgi:hypothetical protein
MNSGSAQERTPDDVVHPVKIITYRSENAPAGREWLAKWLVPVRPSKRTKGALDPADTETARVFPTNPTREGFLPYSFVASTEDRAIAAAMDAWRSSFGKKKQPATSSDTDVFG